MRTINPKGACPMIKYALLAGAALALVSSPALADPSSGHKDQARGEQEIPICSHRIGTLAIVPPDKEWWRELNLGSPEAIIKIFVQQSGCFTMVNRDRAMGSRAMERALADNGELQRGRRLCLVVGRLRGGGRLGLPEHRDRAGDRPCLSRRLQETGRATRRHPAAAGGGSGATVARSSNLSFNLAAPRSRTAGAAS